MNTKVSFLLGVLSALSLSSLSAQTLISDNFESYTPPTLTTGGTNSFRAANGNTGVDSNGRYSIVKEDSSDHFEEGTNNQFMVMGRDTLTNTADNNAHSKFFSGISSG